MPQEIVRRHATNVILLLALLLSAAMRLSHVNFTRKNARKIFSKIAESVDLEGERRRDLIVIKSVSQLACHAQITNLSRFTPKSLPQLRHSVKMVNTRKGGGVDQPRNDSARQLTGREKARTIRERNKRKQEEAAAKARERAAA